MWSRKKKKRRVFAWLSDTHAGKKTGLLNPDTVLLRVQDDGSEEEWQPEPTMTQRWLWSVYENAVSGLADYAGDDEILIAHCGDITHGDKHAGTIPETTREDQRIIACDNFHPLLALPQLKKMRFLTGTEAHVPECAEARIATRLRNETGLDISVCHHARFNMGPDIIDGSHHGPYPGSRDWLKGNVATYYLKDRIYLDRRAGVEPARVYPRSHYHHFVHVTVHDIGEGEHCEFDLIIIPAFAGLDGFVRKVANSPPVIQAGIIALEFINGHLEEIKPFIEEIDLRTEEAL
jgi:hypothetical protein